jgi:NTE family protein
MPVVLLSTPPLAGEDHAKDIDFSHGGITQRWQAGYDDTRSVLAQAPEAASRWKGSFCIGARAGKMVFEG